MGAKRASYFIEGAADGAVLDLANPGEDDTRIFLGEHDDRATSGATPQQREQLSAYAERASTRPTGTRASAQHLRAGGDRANRPTHPAPSGAAP
ncbi:hypothetical protein [Streptomyces sp. NPDC054765]